MPVLVVCGPSAVGKSAVGWQLYQRARKAGLHTAFVDLGQVGFLRPAPPDDPNNDRVKTSNLAALWSTFASVGAQCLVVVGPVADRASADLCRQALPEANVVVCRLHASPGQLFERVALRGRGQNWSEPGDPLKGQPAARLSELAAKAAKEAQELEGKELGDISVDTNGRAVEDVVGEIAALTNGWPGGSDR